MQYAESLDAVVQECRFVLGGSAFASLLPDLGRAIPPLGYLEFMDTTRNRTMLGYPIERGARLLSDLHRLVVSELGRCLADPDHAEDAAALGAEQLSVDPYVRTLTDLLVRASAQGDRLHLDGILWVEIQRTVASLLNNDVGLVDELRRHVPLEATKGEKYLVDMLRLKGTNPARHAMVKNRVLRSLLARNDFAITSVSEVVGDVYSSPLYRAMVSARLPFTEKPDGLYAFFDLKELFEVLDLPIDRDTWTQLHGVLSAAAEGAYERVGTGQGEASDRYLVETFVSDELLEKAGRLEIADPDSTAGDPEGFAGRVAWLLCIQPAAATYLLAHLDQTGDPKALAKKAGLDKELARKIRNPKELRPLAGPFVEVCTTLLKWDFFNTLGGFLRGVERDPTGRLTHDGNALRSSVVSVDLTAERELYSPRRHGTAVFLQIADFTRKAGELLGERGDSDFVSLCIQSLMQIRRTISLLRGQPRYFADGLLVDSFPRALDALRYVALFRAAFERNRHVRSRPWEDARANPFAEELRVGLGTGDYFEVTIPGGGMNDQAPTEPHPVGRVMTVARQLVAEPAVAAGAGEIEEYDPLRVFQTRVAGGALENRGIVAFESTFKEVAAAVRLEGLPHWSPAEPDGVIAGRRITMKNYRFALIFDDPATGQVVLARRLDPSPVLPGASSTESAVYEFLLMWPDAFATFLERVHDMERHQPALRRRRLGATAQPAGRPGRSVAAGRPRKSAALPDLSPSVPAAALNLPGEEDFGLPQTSASSEIEVRLGMSQDDLSLSGDLSAGFSGGFDWGATEPPDSPAARGPSGLPERGPAPDEAPADFDLGPAPGWSEEGDLADLDEPIDALPLEDSDPPPGMTPRLSILGSLDADLAGRIRRLEQEARADSQSRAAVSRGASEDEDRETLRVPRPDFHLMFRDYVYFWIGGVGEPGSEIAIGRRYRDVFFDLHRFSCVGAAGGPDEAIQKFLRGKIRTNFVPQSLNYEALPESAGEQYPLTVERLEAAFDQIT